MSDASVRNQSGAGQRLADALLRATGGYMAALRIPAAASDGTDAGQVGLHAPVYQELTLAPASFRRTRAVMPVGDAARYELLVSASAVEQQVSLLSLGSADALFSLAAGVHVAGLNLVIENWSAAVSLNEAVVYRLQLRVAAAESVLTQTGGA